MRKHEQDDRTDLYLIALVVVFLLGLYGLAEVHHLVTAPAERVSAPGAVR